MTLRELKEVYRRVDEKIASLESSGSSCGICVACCCFPKLVYNTKTEFDYILAFLEEEGRPVDVEYEYCSIKSLDERIPDHQWQCPFLGEGGCTVYPARPLACRLFGHYSDNPEKSLEGVDCFFVSLIPSDREIIQICRTLLKENGGKMGYFTPKGYRDMRKER